MGYSRVHWQNSPSTATPLDEANLNIMDVGIENAADKTDSSTQQFTGAIAVSGDANALISGDVNSIYINGNHFVWLRPNGLARVKADDSGLFVTLQNDGSTVSNTLDDGSGNITARARVYGHGAKVFTLSAGGGGDTLEIADTATGNSKWIRMDGDGNKTLQILNHAFSTPILTLDDSGNLTIAGSLITTTQAPGYEFGYDQITSPVTVSSATEASGTTVISCAAHVFDGSPVMATFFSPNVSPGSGDVVSVNLFEGGTQIGRLALVNSPTALTISTPVTGSLRFTPTAASHTYTVTAIRTTNNGTITAGASGTGTAVPAYMRFTKV